MTDLATQFFLWIGTQRPAGAVPEQLDAERVRICTPYATAEVNLYPFEESHIVEFRIERTSDGESTFFLHFMLDDMDRAKELFGQMQEALEDEAHHLTTRILLSCTSALTTSMFSAKMGEVAHTLSLGYEFMALPAEQALATKEDFAAILLAPQVAHLRKDMMAAHPQALVFEIPAKIFGSYDAAGAVRLLMHALRELHAPGDDTELKAVRDLGDDRRVLVITLFHMRDYARLGYRLYDCGKTVYEGSAQKPKLDFRDVKDLLEASFARDPRLREIDAIGLAVPGITYRGSVTLPDVMADGYDLGQALSRRFDIPVYVDNNCNAAAVGCYVSQSQHESLVFFRQAFGHEAGGFGTVIDGKLLKGFQNLAGEPKFFERRFSLPPSYDEALWTAQGMHELALDVSLASISLIAPEALYLAVDTVDDAEEFHQVLCGQLGERYAPEVHIVTDYVERVYLGELAMCLQKLRDPKYRSLGVGV